MPLPPSRPSLPGDRPLRLVLIDLLHEADLVVVEGAGVGRRDGDHRLQDKIGPWVRRRSGMMPSSPMPPIVPGCPVCQARHSARNRVSIGIDFLYDGATPFHSASRSASDGLKVIFPADTRPGHYHLAEGVMPYQNGSAGSRSTRILVHRVLQIVPTRWLRRRINAESFYPPRTVAHGLPHRRRGAAESLISAASARRRDADAETSA